MLSLVHCAAVSTEVTNEHDQTMHAFQSNVKSVAWRRRLFFMRSAALFFFVVACGQSTESTEAGAGPSCTWTGWDGATVVCPVHTCCNPGPAGPAWCNSWWCDDAVANSYHQCTSLPCISRLDAGQD